MYSVEISDLARAKSEALFNIYSLLGKLQPP